MNILADYNLPFAIALGLMAMLSALQILGLGEHFGDPDVDLGTELDANASGVGFSAGLMSLLGIGRVPFLVWLIAFLFLFAGIGVGIQALATSFTGGPLDGWLAAILSLCGTVPTTSALVRPLAKIMPQDETSAVGLDTLVGRRATITTGRAAAAFPARARVRDRHGHIHHVMVEPHEAGAEIAEGEEILLVRREGQTFFGVTLAERRLAPIAGSGK